MKKIIFGVFFVLLNLCFIQASVFAIPAAVTPIMVTDSGTGTVGSSGGIHGGISADNTGEPDSGSELQTIMTKAVLQGVYDCYVKEDNLPGNDSSGTEAVRGEVNYSEYSSGTKPFSFMLQGNNVEIPLVTGWRDLGSYFIGDQSLNCDTLFNGSSDIDGIGNANLSEVFPSIVLPTAENDGAKTFLEQMGYTVDPGDYCLRLYFYKDPFSDSFGSDSKICWKSDGSVMIEETKNGGGILFSLSDDDDYNNKMLYLNIDGLNEPFWSGFLPDRNADKKEFLTISLGEAFDKNKNCSKEGSKYLCNISFGGTEENFTFDINELFTEEGGDSGLIGRFDKPRETIANSVVHNLDSRFSNYTDLALSATEKRKLYGAYLTNYYSVQGDCYKTQAGGSIDTKDHGDSQGQFGDEGCVVDVETNIDKKVNMVNDRGYFDGTTGGWTGVVNAYVALYNGPDPSGGTTTVVTPDDEEEITCYNSSAAGSLAWIICPLLDITSNASSALFGLVEPLLQISPQLLSGGDNQVREAWDGFRNIANTVFIIILLIVVFSQITGFGVDNYGIKKILPRLLIAAILINFSYFICQVFIDLSNIIGNGIQTLFNSLSFGAPKNVDGVDIAERATGAGVMIVVPILASLVVANNVIKTPALLISFFTSVVGALLSGLMLLVMLSAREAIVVIGTVLAPLAVVCYMLPNTKKLFDKWVGFGKAALLIYPICGLMVAGGNAVSKLLLATTATNTIGLIVAMLVGILPVFFIPSVVKNSMNAISGLGGKISAFGDKFSGRVTGGVKRFGENSNFIKNKAFKAQQWRNNKLVDVARDYRNGKYTGVRGVAARLIGGSDMTMSRRIAEYDKAEKDNLASAVILAQYQEANGANLKDEFKELSKSKLDNKNDLIRFRALASLFANTPGYGGVLTGGFEKGSSEAKRELAAFSSRHRDVQAAITKQSQVGGRMLSDIRNEKSENGEMAYSNLDLNGYYDRLGVDGVRKIFDGMSPSDFLAQNSASVEKAFSNPEYVSTEKLEQFAGNSMARANADSDVLQLVDAELERRKQMEVLNAGDERADRMNELRQLQPDQYGPPAMSFKQAEAKYNEELAAQQEQEQAQQEAEQRAQQEAERKAQIDAMRNAMREAYENAQANSVVSVQHYEPKLVIPGQPKVVLTVRTMSDGRMLDENNNAVTPSQLENFKRIG